jgi:ketosteroid isomerase-like protein
MSARASSAGAAGARPQVTPPQPGGSHARLIAIAAALLLAIAGVAIVLLATRDGGHGPAIPTPVQAGQPTAPPPVTSERVAAPSPSISLESIRQLLGDYQTAYSNEDLTGLRNLFADDLVRQNGTDQPQDLTGALTTYQAQFDQLTNATYQLSDLSVTRGSNDAAVLGDYSITSNNGTVTGAIRFHLVEKAGLLLIDRLEIRPSG